MTRHWSIPLAVATALTGCGPTARETGDGPVMTAARHSHYHVHGPEIDHDHSHDDFPHGGHNHEHAGHARPATPPSDESLYAR